MKIKEGGVMDIQKLTKEQAVIISGFTGILCGEFSDFHADVEKRLGRGVQTFEFGFKEFSAEVKRLYEADFIEMGTVSKEEAKAQAVPDLGELQERIAGHQYYHDEHGHMIVDMDDVVKEISGFDSWKAQAVPEKTVKLHLVWNENKDECVGFLDSKDARYTATGDDRGMFGVTALGDYFRDLNDERNEFETQIVMIEAQEPAND